MILELECESPLSNRRRAWHLIRATISGVARLPWSGVKACCLRRKNRVRERGGRVCTEGPEKVAPTSSSPSGINDASYQWMRTCVQGGNDTKAGFVLGASSIDKRLRFASRTLMYVSISLSQRPFQGDIACSIVDDKAGAKEGLRGFETAPEDHVGAGLARFPGNGNHRGTERMRWHGFVWDVRFSTGMDVRCEGIIVCNQC